MAAIDRMNLLRSRKQPLAIFRFLPCNPLVFDRGGLERFLDWRDERFEKIDSMASPARCVRREFPLEIEATGVNRWAF
jgi:hypothetical protein